MGTADGPSLGDGHRARSLFADRDQGARPRFNGERTVRGLDVERVAGHRGHVPARCGEEAVHATLSHLHGMVRDFGYPIAPECWNSEYEPYFDLHYNWDGAMVLPLLDRLAGVHLSIPEQRLTVEDHLPKDWTFVEVQLPIPHGTTRQWTTIRVERTGTPTNATKSVAVRNCPLSNISIRPWTEDREVRGNNPRVFSFKGRSDVDVRLSLGPYTTPTPLRAWVTPRTRVFLGSVTVQVENLDKGSEIRYTLDGTDPTPASSMGDAPIR